MGFESIPNKNEPGEHDTGKARKWLEFVDKNGVKTNVGVFGNETDEEALARARGIDARLGNGSVF